MLILPLNGLLTQALLYTHTLWPGNAGTHAPRVVSQPPMVTEPGSVELSGSASAAEEYSAWLRGEPAIHATLVQLNRTRALITMYPPAISATAAAICRSWLVSRTLNRLIASSVRLRLAR